LPTDLIEQHAAPFDLPQGELDFLKGYLHFLGDERLLLAHRSFPPPIGYLEKAFPTDTYFNTSGSENSAHQHLAPAPGSLSPSQQTGWLQATGSEINHYRHIAYLRRY
jgi:hypothetical protein